MEQFYEFEIIDGVSQKRVKGVIKGSDILEMVRVLNQCYKNIDHISMTKVPVGVKVYETSVSHLQTEKGGE